MPYMLHRRLATVGLLLLPTQACTTLRPVAGDPSPGQRVRAQLAAEGQIRQAQFTGVARTSLDGDVLSVDSETLVLRVPILGIDPELHRNTKVADTLRVPRADVTSLDTQRFSPARTGLLAGGIAAAGALGVLLAKGIGSSEGVEDGPGHRSAFRRFIAAIRVPVGL